MLSIKQEYLEFSIVFKKPGTNVVLHKLLKNLSEREMIDFYTINPKYFNISSEAKPEKTNAKKRDNK